jgi:hypothetical protein
MKVTKEEMDLIKRIRKLKRSKCPFGKFLGEHLSKKNGHKVGDKCWMTLMGVLNEILKNVS